MSIEGLRIRNCKAAAILLRAEHFRLQSTTIESCDVGVDVAENASQVLIEGNRFANNRVGVRFAASNRNTIVVKNEFSEHRDAGIWAVRGEPDQRGEAISIRENRFTKERIGILAANVSVLMERNELLDTREAAMQLMGTGAVARGNRISGGAAMGIVAENSRGAVIEDNELDGLEAYGIMVKGSADTLVRGNRVHNSGYGLAFVLGNARSPSTAIDNTIIEPKFNGIDVIGDSPILRGNQVLRPRALALKVVDFEPEGGAEGALATVPRRQQLRCRRRDRSPPARRRRTDAGPCRDDDRATRPSCCPLRRWSDPRSPSAGRHLAADDIRHPARHRRAVAGERVRYRFHRGVARTAGARRDPRRLHHARHGRRASASAARC